jgi:hypothetical protein
MFECAVNVIKIKICCYVDINQIKNINTMIVSSYSNLLLMLSKFKFDDYVDMFKFVINVVNLVYQNQRLILMSTCLSLMIMLSKLKFVNMFECSKK